MDNNQTTKSTNERLTYIQKCLKVGDKTQIAREMGVTRVWVSYVLNGRGTSEPVLQAAENLIHQKHNQDA